LAEQTAGIGENVQKTIDKIPMAIFTGWG
jgi:hypothetical protein